MNAVKLYKTDKEKIHAEKIRQALNNYQKKRGNHVLAANRDDTQISFDDLIKHVMSPAQLEVMNSYQELMIKMNSHPEIFGADKVAIIAVEMIKIVERLGEIK